MARVDRENRSDCLYLFFDNDSGAFENNIEIITDYRVSLFNWVSLFDAMSR